MPEHIKSLVIILFLGLFVFYILRKAFEVEIPEGDFLRWRNTWVLLTITSFSLGNFLMLMVACALVLAYAAKKIDNRFAFFLILLLVIPNYALKIQGLLDMSYTRMLTLVILLPILMSKKLRPGTPSLGKPLADKLMIALLILIFLLSMRGTTPGDALRTGVVFFLDWFLPYFVASRVINDFDQLKKALIALVAACSIAGLIGFFEHTKAWLLYYQLAFRLNVDGTEGVMRDGSLRGTATLDHPLSLGLIMMVAFGLYLFLMPMIKSKKIKWLYFIALCLGLYGPLSRGPWSGAVIIVLLFTLSGKKVIKRLSLILIGGLISIQVLPTLPGGQKLLNLMPFIGTTEQFNVEYRQELIPRAVIIIKRNPLFGVFEPLDEPELSDMVQGEGIVDIVNSYLNISLQYGLVGLILYVWFFLLSLFVLRKSMKYIKNKRSEEYLCGRSLFAVMVGVLVTISTVSFLGTLTTVIFALAGLMFSYARIITNAARNNTAKQPA